MKIFKPTEGVHAGVTCVVQIQVEIMVEEWRCQSFIERLDSALRETVIIFSGRIPRSGAAFIGAEFWRGAWLRRQAASHWLLYGGW